MADTGRLELRAVDQRLGGNQVLHRIDLDIVAGRTTVLIGPSGCGKSTILRLMIGLLAPDSGEVLFDGDEVRSPGLAARRHRMGYVIQDGGLFPHLTAAENASLAARCLGWEARRIRTRLNDLIELVRLPADALDRYPTQLSGGQRQRVSLLRALMLDPAVLLLDEPLAALDPMIRAELQEDLRAVFRALGKTVVLVTHDLPEAAYFADRLVLLRAGRIVQQGTLADLLDKPADRFVTTFIQAQSKRALLG